MIFISVLIYGCLRSTWYCVCPCNYFLANDWLGKHITIDLFETIEIITQALKKNLVELLDQYKLRKKIIAYVKDEWSILMQWQLY